MPSGSKSLALYRRGPWGQSRANFDRFRGTAFVRRDEGPTNDTDCVLMSEHGIINLVYGTSVHHASRS